MQHALSNLRARYLDRASVFRSLLESQGPVLFSQILQQRALDSTPKTAKPRSYRQIWKNFRQKSLMTHALELQTDIQHLKTLWDEKAMTALLTVYSEFQQSQNKGETLVTAAVKTAGSSSGAILGMNLPSVDVRFFSSESPEQTIVFHSAPRLFTEVTLEWIARLFEMASLSPSLASEDKKFFARMETLVRGVLQGVSVGTTARDEIWKSIPVLRNWLHSEQPLPIDAHSLKMASHWVQEMLRQAASRKSAD